MDSTLIFRAFLLLSGLEEEQAKPYLPLCRSAGASLVGRLRPDADRHANRELLCHAAAAMAYYQYSMLEATKSETVNFSAGDVHIRENADQTRRAATAVYEAAMQSVAHLLGESTPFAFMGVVYR